MLCGCVDPFSFPSDMLLLSLGRSKDYPVVYGSAHPSSEADHCLIQSRALCYNSASTYLARDEIPILQSWCDKWPPTCPPHLHAKEALC